MFHRAPPADEPLAVPPDPLGTVELFLGAVVVLEEARLAAGSLAHLA